MKTQRTGEYYAAVYAILQDNTGKYLFQRRYNTGFNDGILQFSSGHIEGEETYFEALKREVKEEINIDIEESDVELAHVMHRICKGSRVYFDIYFTIKSYSGSIQNMELDKCSELDFFDLSNPDITLYNKKVIEDIEAGIQVSEVIM